MRFLLPILTVLMGTPGAAAQIIAVELTDDAPAREFKDIAVSYRGLRVVIGEPKAGFSWDRKTGRTEYLLDGVNELFVVDRKKPGRAAYYLSNGEKVAAGKKHVLAVSGLYVKSILLMERDQTLPGLAAHYRSALEQIKQLRRSLKKHPKQTPGWYVVQHRIIASLEVQERWLAAFGFTNALKTTQKELKRERKAAWEAPLQVRAEKNQASVRITETPAALTRVSVDEYGGKHVFHSVVSEHFRLHYLVEGNSGSKQHVNDQEALAMLSLAENIVDGFRAEFVSPYLGEDFPDTIPEGLLGTWFFGPQEDKAYLRYCDALFGYQRSPMAGGGDVQGETAYGGDPLRLQYFWRLGRIDLAGTIGHQTGHVLAMMHYGSNDGPIQQAWLEEAVANSMASRYLGRCGPTCWGMRQGQGYLHRDITKPGKRAPVFGQGMLYNFIALKQAGPIQAIALKRLYELDDVDLAKAWSFYEYVVRFEGKPGQLYLRAAGELSRDKYSMIEHWRERAAEIFGVDQREALKGIESRWRAYVEKLLDEAK